jgi:hypothetical protein
MDFGGEECVVFCAGLVFGFAELPLVASTSMATLIKHHLKPAKLGTEVQLWN